MKRAISDINALTGAEAVDLLGGLFERSPWIVRETWPQAPFASVDRLHAALCETLAAAPAARQLALIRAHPDLVGQAATAGTLTRESSGEQNAAELGPDHLSPEDVEIFRRNNAAYRERFGFPFVICARENRKASILAGFAARLKHDRNAEHAAAIAEIERIAWYRLTDLVDNGLESGGD